MKRLMQRYLLPLGVLVFAVSTADAAPKKKAKTIDPAAAAIAEHDAARKAHLQEVIDRMAKEPTPHVRIRKRRMVPSTALQLNKEVIRRVVKIESIVDGRVVYSVPSSMKKPILAHAILANGTEALVRTKVGTTATLHLQQDPKGFAYVTDVTRVEVR